MLSYFPTPYPDEIFYSLIARYNYHLGCTDHPKKFLPSLFGSSTICATIDFPSHLTFFHQQAGANLKYSLAETIEQFTLFPFYHPFLPTVRSEKIAHSMLTSSGDIHTLAGLNASIFPPLNLPRYCPYCFIRDCSIYGEAYWHRSHQIPSISFCTKHTCYLITAKNHHSTLNKHFFIPATREFCPETNSEPLNNSQAIKIARSLLNYQDERESLLKKEGSIRKVLLERGFRKGEKKMDILLLYEAFTAFFSNETLQLFKSPVAYSNASCWLKAIVRKHRKVFEPIRHMLLKNFIASLKRTEPTEQSTFYPCLNKICSYYKQPVANCTEQHYDIKAKRVIQTVFCIICGYTYTRSYLKKTKEYFARVKDYGSLWQTRLISLHLQKLPTREIARILGCDSKTVQFQFLKLKGQTPSPSDKKEKVLEEKRVQWQTLQKENAQLTISQLRNLQTALYAWIYRNDRSWLSSIAYLKPRPANSSEGVDWDKRDQVYLQVLENVLNELNQNGEKRRLSKSFLIGCLSHSSSIEKHLNKLPKLEKFLNTVTETPEQHRLRRLHLAYQQLMEEDEGVSRWRLLRMANIRKEYCTCIIEKEIQRITHKHFNQSSAERKVMA